MHSVSTPMHEHEPLSKHINSRTTTSAQRINTYVTSCTWTISKNINPRNTTSAQRINTYVSSMKMIHEERTIKNVITPPTPPHPKPPQPTPSVSTPMSRQWRWTIEDLSNISISPEPNEPSCKTTSTYEAHVQRIKMCKLSGAPSPRATINNLTFHY